MSNRGNRQTPVEERIAAEAMAVALAQPHRKATQGRWEASKPSGVGTPLFEIVGRLRLREELYQAGVEYGHTSRRGKIALDINVPGMIDERGDGESEEEKAKRLAADKRKYREIIGVLKRISLQHFFCMEEVCFYERAVHPKREAFVLRGLSAAALHFGLLGIDVYAP